MRIKIDPMPSGRIPGEVAIGDVFPVAGGRGKGSRWQVIVAMTDTHAYLLVFDSQGEICGCQYYGIRYLSERVVVGKVDGIEDIVLDVNWYASP